MTVEAGTHLEKHIELLQIINTEGSLCDYCSDLKHQYKTLKSDSTVNMRFSTLIE